MMNPDGPPPGEADRFDPDSLFNMAADLSRATGQTAFAGDLVAAHVASRDRAREAGMREGREALAAALLSELDAAKPDFAVLCDHLDLIDLKPDDVLVARATWKLFADHLRQWLDAGAPERSALDRAWELINAQGGSGDTEYDRGRSDAFDGALEIIEQLGGMDPAKRKAADRG